MLGRAKRHPASLEESRLIAVQPGSELLAEHHARVESIRSMIGVPEQHWRLLYQPLFSTYAEYVQRMAPSEPPTHAEGVSLLQRALEVVDLALKVRRGYVLPPAKEPEIVANEQDVWTYAVVTAALLRDFGKGLYEQCFITYRRDSMPLGTWNAWVEPVTRTGCAYYRINRRHCDEWRSADAVTPLLVAHVVPKDGLRWLGGHDDLLKDWIDAISGQVVGVSVIARIVREASDRAAGNTLPLDTRTAAPDGEACGRQSSGTTAQKPLFTWETSESDPAQTQPVHDRIIDDRDGLSSDPAYRSTLPAADAEPPDPGEAFVEWLTNALTSGVLQVNTAKGSVHIVDSGLLLVSPAVFRAFAGEKWRHVQKRFFKRRMTEKSANGENFFHYLLNSESGQRTIKGLLISDPEEKLGVSLPEVNPRLSLKFDGR